MGKLIFYFSFGEAHGSQKTTWNVDNCFDGDRDLFIFTVILKDILLEFLFVSTNKQLRNMIWSGHTPISLLSFKGLQNIIKIIVELLWKPNLVIQYLKSVFHNLFHFVNLPFAINSKK